MPAAPEVDADVGAVVLVEGRSDQRAVETLAECAGRDLRAEGVAVVAMGGATNIAYFLRLFGPPGRGLRIAGLCDVDQVDAFRRALQRCGLPGDDLARLGFFVCDVDLEDELIRALGPEVVEQIIAEEGELGSLRLFENQPAQRGRPRHLQLRRFLGTRAGRKIQYARRLVEALEPARVPPPLCGLLGAV